MATMSVFVRVDRFPKILAAANAAAAAATAKAAHDIEAKAKSRAPVDTGNLRNSINSRGSGTKWEVHSPAEYSVFQEFGTRHHPPHPFMVPAVEEVRPVYLGALKTIV